MMNKTNKMSGRVNLGLRTVTYGATTALVMHLSGLNISLDSGARYLSFEFGSRAVADSTAPVLNYNPPYRGSPQRTEATGARGADDYFAPYRGAPTSTQATGSRGSTEYTPPGRGEPESTQATGSRGGNLEVPLTLTLLIPTDHTGRTTSGHPTFYWDLSSEAKVPVEFTLVKPGQTEPIFVQRIATSKAGIIQVEMPKNLPDLAVGQKYRWSVSLVRNDKRRSDDVFVQGWVERVATTPDLDKQLATATSTRQRAQVYAKAGLFYDALASISQAYNQAPNDKSIAEERLSLLEQVGQTAVVKQERQRLAAK